MTGSKYRGMGIGKAVLVAASMSTAIFLFSYSAPGKSRYIAVSGDIPYSTIVLPTWCAALGIYIGLTMGKEAHHELRFGADFAFVNRAEYDLFGMALISYRFHFLGRWWVDPFIGAAFGFVWGKKESLFEHEEQPYHVRTLPIAGPEVGMEIYVRRKKPGLGFKLSCQYYYHPDTHIVIIPISFILWIL